MTAFNYEWYTVTIVSVAGPYTYEVKAKNKNNAIKQIEKLVAYSKSEKNNSAPIWCREPEVIDVLWDTMKLDRVGYQRLS